MNSGCEKKKGENKKENLKKGGGPKVNAKAIDISLFDYEKEEVLDGVKI